MVYPRHPRTAAALPALTRSTERTYLAKLASELAPYGVWARVVEDGVPFLRVSNPKSEYAIEDVSCERRSYDYAFLTTFGVCLGSSDSLPLAARRTAWLVGATPA
ncbi:hypothetical protein [Nocardiopsis ansamitocini]|uniref:Uncharacterized protein n=1 Tax=Nocardiopsis ansamitocini TaxID=1670832 RepID=A0A9W6P9Z2_9ACTN|nr:hypothetical protein [Nocardiopsis ansamitocini]GLU49708.1 hypothetical protein Nans01_40590 [Nocardiopsis ansamitocini]